MTDTLIEEPPELNEASFFTLWSNYCDLKAQIQDLQAERDKAVEARSKRDWQCGYLVALGTLIYLEGTTPSTEEILGASSITREQANSLGLTDFDMDGINEQFDEIEARDAATLSNKGEGA